MTCTLVTSPGRGTYKEGGRLREPESARPASAQWYLILHPLGDAIITERVTFICNVDNIHNIGRYRRSCNVHDTRSAEGSIHGRVVDEQENWF